MKMKNVLSLALSLALLVTMLSACGNAAASSSAAPAPAPASSGESSSAPAWAPSKEINWICTSSPGGGSDIYTRMISDIMTTEGLVAKTFLVNNLTDGGGEIGRLQVAMTKSGDDADHTLLTFNSGDLMPMCLNTDNRIENFTPIAVMAVDKQLLFKGEHTKYADFSEALAAAQAGTPVTIGGSKGDDVATYEALMAELGLELTQMPYITYDGTGDAITALLGGHVDLLISKPAAASEYVAAEMIHPVLALATERYTGNLADAPTLSEIGDYDNVEIPVWRGVVGPKNMSPEAAAFWSEALKKVSETEKWNTSYLEKNKLIANYMDQAAAAEFMTQYQTNYLASIGKDK